MQKTVSATITKGQGNDGTFVLTSTALDRDGDVISESAMKSAIKSVKELLALWQHKTDQPVGKWVNLRMVGTQVVGELKLAATNLGLMIKQLLDEDVPLSASIGFMGTGDYDEKQRRITWKEIELLECSIVSIPSNPEARRIAKSFGIEIQSSDDSACSKYPCDIISRAKLAAGDRATVAIHQARSVLQ